MTAGATDNVQVAVKDASNATAAQTIAVTTETVPFTPAVLEHPDLFEVLIAGAPTASGGIKFQTLMHRRQVRQLDRGSLYEAHGG